MADKDFDIKRAYEKWVEQGQPVYSDSKKDSRKSAGKNNAHRTKGHEEKNGDRRTKGQEAKNGDRRTKGQEAKNSDRRTKGHEVTGRSHRTSEERIEAGGTKSSPRPADEEKQCRPKFVADPDAPQCPHRRRCGGCEYIGRNYKWTLAQKEKKTFALLKPYVKLSGIVGMDDPYHYRNKVTSTFAHIKDGRKERNICGIYEQGTHKVVSIDSCLIENEKADAIVRDILEL